MQSSNVNTTVYCQGEPCGPVSAIESLLPAVCLLREPQCSGATCRPRDSRHIYGWRKRDFWRCFLPEATTYQGHPLHPRAVTLRRK